MSKTYGIDISKHNGDVDYIKVKESGVEFAIIRAGYGKGNIDSKFVRNMEGCLEQGIKIGAYWFLYSLTVQDAKAEAEYMHEALLPYWGKLQFPVACDFEYDSEAYMIKKGVTPTKRLNTDIVIAFCERLKELGWYVVNYANIDYINNHFYQRELEQYDLWLARWNVKEPNLTCGIWQYSSEGKVSGSSHHTDLNYAFKDYPNIITNGGYNGYKKITSVPPNETAKSVEEIALEVIGGKWGNGETRKELLAIAGYDYATVQAKVNEILKRKSEEEIAQEVIQGKWDNGTQRKELLMAAGYDYDKIQEIVNALLK